MTSLTIELPTDIYKRLQSEAQRQGKAEQKVVEELLVACLAVVNTDSIMPIYLNLEPEVQVIPQALS